MVDFILAILLAFAASLSGIQLFYSLLSNQRITREVAFFAILTVGLAAYACSIATGALH